MKKHKKVIIIVGGIELMILAFFVVLISTQSINKLDVDISQWKSDYIAFENNSWFIKEDEITKENIDLIYGPYIEIDGGGYTVEVDYVCEDNQKLQIYAGSGNLSYLRANSVTLSKNQTFLSYDFELTEDIDNLEIVIKYNGKGDCRINNILIKENHNILKRWFVYILCIFVLFDIVYIFRQQIHKNKKTILAILLITLCISLPLFYKGMNNGHDGMFHQMRIEGIAKELSFKNFPVRIQSIWMEGYGYAVSLYYGDILLYIPALLRLMGFTITQCFKCYIMLINLGTVFFSYISFNKIYKKKNISLLLAFVYGTASYRLENVYIRCALGEYTAMMFLPIIAAAIYGIYLENESNWNIYKKNALLLSIGMTGLIINHILSTEMVCFVLVILSLLFIKKTIRKNTIRVFVLSIIQTLLFSCYFLVPFLDYYLNVDVQINATVDNIQSIQNKGVYLVQFFSFWQNIKNQNAFERFQMTPGIILMVTLFIAIFLWIQKKANKEMKIMIMLSFVTLYLASNLFPWDYIAKHFVLGNVMAQVQFPWRYLEIAIVFMTLLLGELLTIKIDTLLGIQNIQSLVYTSICIVCIYSVCFFSSSYCNEVGVYNYYYDTAELDNKRIGSNAEYLLLDTDRNFLSNDIIYKNMDNVLLKNRLGNYMEIYCEVTEKEGWIELPLYNYKGYQVTDDKENKITILNGKNNNIAFKLPDGFSGNVYVKFVEPWYWKVALCVSVLSILGSGVIEIRRKYH